MRSLYDARTKMLGYFARPDHYDGFTRRLLGTYQSRVVADVATAGLDDTKRMLDVGTGPGRVPLAIANAVPGVSIDGLDLSPSMIEYARRAARAAGFDERVTFVVGDVADLPYPDHTFDLILSSMSQHHWADSHAGLRELRRVLRPNGRIWIYDVRPALRRAITAARDIFPSNVIRSETVRIGRLPISIIGKLTVEDAGT
jgi:ubiquinone/menaquinone biosynthesis C-methylase UbiE